MAFVMLVLLSGSDGPPWFLQRGDGAVQFSHDSDKATQVVARKLPLVGHTVRYPQANNTPGSRKGPIGAGVEDLSWKDELLGIPNGNNKTGTARPLSMGSGRRELLKEGQKAAGGAYTYQSSVRGDGVHLCFTEHFLTNERAGRPHNKDRPYPSHSISLLDASTFSLQSLTPTPICIKCISYQRISQRQFHQTQDVLHSHI
ncbi:hypothetical protein GGR56DRAFT_220188 [Xylariaceae sp. FL0804]|nr:hypothetical protein GGR56DRAFT_220188 [Xylariaceae sp. FL0804]